MQTVSLRSSNSMHLLLQKAQSRPTFIVALLERSCFEYIVKRVWSVSRGSHLSEPPYYRKTHHEHSFNETRLYPFPTPSLPSLFNSKSIELLTRSGEVLVYYIQQWRHRFESGKYRISSRAKNLMFFYLHRAWSSPLWSIGVPLTFMDPFTCMGPLRFYLALLHLNRALRYHLWGPLRPSGRGIERWSAPSVCEV